MAPSYSLYSRYMSQVSGSEEMCFLVKILHINENGAASMLVRKEP